jgi:hypothetical protein
MNLVECFLSGNLTEARELINKRIEEIFEQKLEERKVKIVVKESEKLAVNEANVQKLGRTKLIRMRVRNNKVQRRKKLSNVKGYTIRGGNVVRLSSMEHRHRLLGARRAKIKNRSKKNQILRKRRISLRKRKAMGIR